MVAQGLNELIPVTLVIENGNAYLTTRDRYRICPEQQQQKIQKLHVSLYSEQK